MPIFLALPGAEYSRCGCVYHVCWLQRATARLDVMLSMLQRGLKDLQTQVASHANLEAVQRKAELSMPGHQVLLTHSVHFGTHFTSRPDSNSSELLRYWVLCDNAAFPCIATHTH